MIWQAGTQLAGIVISWDVWLIAFIYNTEATTHVQGCIAGLVTTALLGALC